MILLKRILNWLSLQGNKTQHLSVNTFIKHSEEAVHNHVPTVGFNFVPGPGQHYLNYKGKHLLVQRIREQQMVDFNSGKPFEKVLFTGLGRDARLLSI
jgi:chaperone BCS1